MSTARKIARNWIGRRATTNALFVPYSCVAQIPPVRPLFSLHPTIKKCDFRTRGGESFATKPAYKDFGKRVETLFHERVATLYLMAKCKGKEAHETVVVFEVYRDRQTAEAIPIDNFVNKHPAFFYCGGKWLFSPCCFELEYA